MPRRALGPSPGRLTFAARGARQRRLALRGLSTAAVLAGLIAALGTVSVAAAPVSPPGLIWPAASAVTLPPDTVSGPQIIAPTAAAEAYSPPRGTPDLAKMTLQPSDLARGATVLSSGYLDPASGLNLRAEYDRDFGAAATTAGVKLGQIQVSITLADSTAYAKALFAQIPPTYGTQAGHAILALEVVPISVNGFHPTPNNARFGKLHSAGIGQQSLLESGTITTKDATIGADFVWLRVDGVLASLAVVAAKPPLADSVAIGLARTVAAHITSVLTATR